MLHVVRAQLLIPKQKSEGCTLRSVYFVRTDSAIQVISDPIVRFLVRAVLRPYGIVCIVGAD